MGEPLYEEVVGRDKLDRPCRVYAPVGSHETLLAYLVRRLLENGANTSFVNRIADESVAIKDLIADPVDEASKIVPLGAPHAKIPRRAICSRRASQFDGPRSVERTSSGLAVVGVAASAATSWRAAPSATQRDPVGEHVDVRNPADHRDLVGTVVDATSEHVSAIGVGDRAAPIWQSTLGRAAIASRVPPICSKPKRTR